MKYRCPHCQNVFETFQGSQCPACRKNLRHPDRWKLASKGPSRRTTLPHRRPGTQSLRQPIWFVFVNRPRFLVWVLGGCILVVGFLMTSKFNPGTPYRPPSKVARTQKELVVIRTALEWFRVNCKRYPTTEEGLKALVRNPGIPGWQGFYLQALPPDLWGHPFQYSCSNEVLRLSSLGPDGKAGSPDDISSPPPDYKALVKRLNAGKTK